MGVIRLFVTTKEISYLLFKIFARQGIFLCCFQVCISSEGGILCPFFFNFYKITYSHLAFLIPIL